PGEQVSVNFTMKNLGTKGTTGLVSTLESSGGVTGASGPQNYGTIAGNGGDATKSFSFRADPSLICGGPLLATHRIVENGLDRGVVKFNLTVGTVTKTYRLFENFDGVASPALPPAWTSSSTDSPPALWTTSTISPDSAPNDAFV